MNVIASLDGELSPRINTHALFVSPILGCDAVHEMWYPARNNRCKSLKPPTRSTDSIDETYCRTPERIISYERKWYFQTRQGNHGPYDSREEAELCLERYVETMEFVEDNEPWMPQTLSGV